MVLDSFVSPEMEQARRRSFSIKDKRDFVHKIDIIISTGVSHRQACVRVGLPYLYYAHFKKARQKVEHLENRDVYVPFKTNGTACKIHPGRPSLLYAIKDDLACFVLHASLLPSFRDKSLEVRNSAVGRFTKKMDLSHRVATGYSHHTETLQGN